MIGRAKSVKLLDSLFRVSSSTTRLLGVQTRSRQGSFPRLLFRALDLRR